MRWSLRPSPAAVVAAALAADLLGLEAAPADTVRGYVLQALRDERVPSVEVAFQIPDGSGGTIEVARRTTDESGAFSFAGPFLTAGTTFALTAYYQGLEYGTRNLVVGDQDQVIIEVHEGTEDPSRIHIAAHHLFLSVMDRGVEVLQLVQAENRGTATYVGRLVDDERQVLELALPAGHLGLQAHAGVFVRAGPARLFDTRPLPPGSTQAAFTFQLPAAAIASGDYEHTAIYPTDRLELFLQPPDLSLGAPFRDLGPITLQDQDYRHYRLENLAPGRTVKVPLPVPRPWRWGLKWAMMALVPVVLVAVVALARPVIGGGKPTEAEREQLEQRRRVLLADLARLEAGGRDAPEANARGPQRQRILAEAMEVYRRLGLDG